MDRKHQKILAGFLIVAGLIQAAGMLLQQAFSIVSVITILAGIGYALAGVAFWYDI